MIIGKKIWIYNGAKILNGFPLECKDPQYPINPHTAICKNNVLYLIKVNNYKISFLSRLFLIINSKGSFSL